MKLSLAHLGISVFDFDKQLDFYTRVLRMVVSDVNELPHGPEPRPRIAFLTLSPTDHHQLVLLEGRRPEEIRTDIPFGGSAGSQLMQLSFRLDDLAGMREMKARLEAEGLTNFAPMNHGNAWALYVRDHEGNALEFFVDTEWHVSQPCGFLIDFSKSDEEIYAETKEYCLAQPECKPMTEWHALQAERILAAQNA